MISKISSIIDFLYPPFCLSCSEELTKDENFICFSCSQMLEILSIENRCKYCFEECASNACNICRRKSFSFDGIASVFNYQGVAKKLITALKYNQMPFLSKSIAAYMAILYSKLPWPQIHYIIPVPQSFARKFDRGYNQSLLIAQQFSAIVGIPSRNILRKSCGEYPQAKLDKKKRLKSSADLINVKNTEEVFGKNLLIVDDVLSTGKTISNCAKKLSEIFPKKIYAITFCKSIRNSNQDIYCN